MKKSGPTPFYPHPLSKLPGKRQGAFFAFIQGAFLITASSCAAAVEYDLATQKQSGGDTTVPATHAGAFSLNSANMSSRRKGDFLIGNDFFEDPWVIAPATTDLRDGLGPLFNVSACQSCHFNDGRGHAPANAADDADSLLIRLSRPARNAEEQALLDKPDVANLGDPVYGGQLQDRAIPGVSPEAHIEVSYNEETVSFADGFKVSLRRPEWRLRNWAYGDPADDLTLSLRVAPPVIGLGLLEAIPQADIEALADPQDSNHDGVSGRTNQVWDVEQKAQTLGRFGWKAGQPTVKQQTAGAFNGDMGLTSSLFITDHCTDAQSACKKAPNGADENGIEIRDDILDFVAFYGRNLAVPARRNIEDSIVQTGHRLFREAGCNACHNESFVTAKLGKDHIEQSEQTIFPYTDMLLHDMGPDLADLKLNGSPAPADEVVEHDATATEWRTPPLWGIGLSQVVNPQATYLHDGRARTLLEAVLWHGGEAQQSRDKVLAFKADDRDALVKFLESL